MVHFREGWKRATKNALSLTADYVLMIDGVMRMITEDTQFSYWSIIRSLHLTNTLHILILTSREVKLFFLIVAPYILVYVEFTHQQIHYLLIKKYIKIYIKIHINIGPTCFGLRPSSGSLH